MICENKDMPSSSAFYDCIAADDSLLKKYDTAMRQGADTAFDEILEIADDPKITSCKDVAVTNLRINYFVFRRADTS